MLPGRPRRRKKRLNEAIQAYYDGLPLSHEMSEAAFLLETQWSYEDYVTAPDRVVADMFHLLDAQSQVLKAKEAERSNG